jgi:hypothetical protein
VWLAQIIEIPLPVHRATISSEDPMSIRRAGLDLAIATKPCYKVRGQRNSRMADFCGFLGPLSPLAGDAISTLRRAAPSYRYDTVRRFAGGSVPGRLRWSERCPRRHAIGKQATVNILLALCQSLGGVVRILCYGGPIALISHPPLTLDDPGGWRFARTPHCRHEQDHNRRCGNGNTYHLDFLLSGRRHWDV